MISLVNKRLCLVDFLEFFMKNNASSASTISFSQRSKFVILDHEIEDNEFCIKIYCNKERFSHLITLFVNEMISEIKGNKKLNDSGWDNSTVFVEETETASEYFGCFFFFNSQNLLVKSKNVCYRWCFFGIQMTMWCQRKDNNNISK